MNVATAVTALDSPHAPTRRAAAAFLERRATLGRHAVRHVPALIRALGAKDIAVRAAAATALGCIGEDANTAVGALVGATLTDPAVHVQKAASNALRRIDPEASATVAALAETVEGGSRHILMAAVVTLKAFGRSVAPTLEKALKDAKGAVRTMLTLALDAITGESPVAKPGQEDDNQTKLVADTVVHGGPVPSPEEKIAVTVVLPPDPRERLEAIVGAFTAMRNQAAELMQPAIASLLKEAQQLDFDGKAKLAAFINRALDDTHMTILDPQTGLPAKLKPHRPGSYSQVSYLQLHDTRHADDGRRHRVRIQDGPDQLKRLHPPANPLPRLASDDIKVVPADQESDRAAAAAADQPSAGRGR